MGLCGGRAVPWREGQATQAALDRLLFFCCTATGRTSNSMKLKGDVCTAQNFSEHALWLEPRRCRECKMLSLLKSIEKVVSSRPQTPQMMKKRRKPQGTAPSLRLSNWRGRGCPRPMALPHSPQLALLSSCRDAILKHSPHLLGVSAISQRSKAPNFSDSAGRSWPAFSCR